MDEINRMYQKRGYMDRYGIHLWVSLIICVVFVLAITYYHVDNQMKSLRSNWDEVRCNPFIMPFAGMINKAEGQSAAEYTQQNFESCLDETMRPIAGLSLTPLKHVTNAVATDILTTGKEFAKVNDDIEEVAEEAEETEETTTSEMYERVNPSYILLQQFKAMGMKMTGVTHAITYEVQGILYTIMSIINSLIKLLKKIPGGKTILGKCFAKGTPIRCVDGVRAVEEVVAGDVLWDGSTVTSTMVLSSADTVFYDLGGTHVTDSHNVFHPTKGWIPAGRHPDATLVTTPYPHEHVYCFNTTSKTIKIGEHTFSDWDDLDDIDLRRLQRYYPRLARTNVHVIFDDGYPDTTPMRLKSGETIQLGLLQPGDILWSGEKIYGIVRIGVLGRVRHHLLTDTGSFDVRGHTRGDYNTLIEKYL